MELALGAVVDLAPKLLELLKDEYVKRKGLRPDIESLSRELVWMHAVLADVSKVPRQKLSEVNKVWARQVRELSYDTENAIDAFILCDARRELAADDVNIFKKIRGKAVDIAKNFKDHHQITDKVKDIKNLSKELVDLCAKYRLNSSHANPSAGTSIDPRVLNMYKSETELVGIKASKDEVIGKLLIDDDAGQSLKIVSIVGFGGLGKTTLAKIVHDSLKAQFDCSAFVSVGRNPNIHSVLGKILMKIDGEKYSYVNMTTWDYELFSDELHKLLKDKRFFIVIDDIWDKISWKSILHSLYLKDSNCQSRIIMTTRNADVVTKDEDIYRLKPLSHDNSKLLLSKRILSGEGKCPVKPDEVANKILRKCGGIPLAIIAIASLLANKPRQKWSEVYDSMVSGHDEDSTMEIISYSYDDLPSHLKPCLLYFSTFPEEHAVGKNDLIWMWIGEGFVKIEKEGDNIFEKGERYFYELLNRSMILPVEIDCSIEECSVHDIVFDLICNLSRQENFVTVSVGEQCTSPKRRKKDMDLPSSHMTVRRASLQNCHFKHNPSDILGTPEAIRSLIIENTKVDAIPQLCCLQVCRVLCIERSNIPNLKHLGKLQHLRYLQIHNTRVDRLPEEIADLKSLQTLILVYIGLDILPSAICKLTQLMCMHIAGFENLPANRMGNLVSLEELRLGRKMSRSEIDDLVVQLGKLTRLRVLHISFSTKKLEESLQNALVNSLCSLEKVQDLNLNFDGDHGCIKASAAWEGWEPPQQLWRLSIPHIIFPRLPAWINTTHHPFHLPRLSSLELFADVVEERDLENLARLPELCFLRLRCNSIHQGYTVDATVGFKKLRTCEVPTTFKFQPGAMPSIEALDLHVIVAHHSFTIDGREYSTLPTKDAISDLDFRLENLLSLEKVNVEVDCRGARTSEVKDTVLVLERAIRKHPKQPTFSIERLDEHLKLDEVFHVSVREIKEHLKEHDGILARLWLELQKYERLEELTFHIDCEGARLGEVEKVETALRQLVADVLPKRPTLHLVQESVDKKVSTSDHCSTEGLHDDSASNTTEQSPIVAEVQDMSSNTKGNRASLALD